ncbi:Hypothetical predicted protein [Paramuricea clavata]|uniref:Uncharacterized protein n=1 Tax=Paramuricea clavata TaxID=317549 RepID=A0A7D9L9A1_PARCT|nr:Hypothetical predicted protein [Paramuricea clavata]
MDILNRFSSWFKLKHAVALGTKYVNILQIRVSQKRAGQEPNVRGKSLSMSVLVEDLQQAEHRIIKNVQQHYFHEEVTVLQNLKDGQFKNYAETKTRNQKLKHISSLHRLDPFVDQHGIVRVGGRIKHADVTFQQKHPVVLPKNSYITTLVI